MKFLFVSLHAHLVCLKFCIYCSLPSGYSFFCTSRVQEYYYLSISFCLTSCYCNSNSCVFIVPSSQVCRPLLLCPALHLSFLDTQYQTPCLVIFWSEREAHPSSHPHLLPISCEADWTLIHTYQQWLNKQLYAHYYVMQIHNGNLTGSACKYFSFSGHGST